MGVKPGYKQTEIGVIPEDWEVSSLGEIAVVSSGGTPSRSNATFWDGNIPWVTTTQIDFNVILDALEYITESGLDCSAAKQFTVGTLLMAMYGQGKTRGKVAILGIDAATNQACAAIRLNKSVNSKYVFYNMSNRYEEIRSLSNIGNQENLNANIIKAIRIPLPPQREQQAIADVLSDVDVLITTLDRLIAKKRDIKQAVMQQLLTGKMRLPGFQNKWQTVRFGEIAIPRTDRVNPNCSTHSDFCVELDNIESATGKLLSSRIVSETSSLKSTFWTGDILFGKLRAYLRKYWLADRTGICSTEFWVLSPNVRLVTSSYLYQLIKTEQFIEAASMTYGTHMPRSDWKAVENYEFKLPLVSEQIVIAEALSDMDAEILALEKQRDKTVAIKQGMMQELLTGRTRLV